MEQSEKKNPQPADWCDATRSLLEAPEGSRIERHAVELISRALYARPVVAFVGAGTSMAYGRLSWRDAVIHMQRSSLNAADQAKREGKNSENAGRAKVLLERQKIDPTDDTEPSDYLVAFQLAEQLSKVLSEKNGTDAFRNEVKGLLKDDYGHANLMLQRACERKLVPRAGKKLVLEKTDHPGKRRDIRSHKYLQAILDKIGSARGRAGLRKALRDFTRHGDYLRPYHRFVIETAMHLLPKRSKLVSPIWNTTPVARGALLPIDRDPLRLLYDLSITRFLTTNFDDEVQILFRDEALVRDDATGLSRPEHQQDPLNRVWREIVFDRDHIGHLLAFAARDGRRVAEVVHLHGRATQNITVTTQDYQQLYLAPDERRSGMEDALSAAFGGNPILFVGSGMGEDDLLRPLRQFVGDRAPSPGRLAVALVPLDKKRTKAEAEKIANLQRYGAYTIHFGRIDGPGETVGKTEEESWLYLLSNLARMTQRFLGTILHPKAEEEERSRRARSKGAHNALKVAIKEFTNKAGYKPDWDWDAPQWIEAVCVADHPDLDLGRELALLQLACSYLSASMQPDLQCCRALETAISGCLDSITGAFLCARLIRLKTDWEAWRTEWLTLPTAENTTLVLKDRMVFQSPLKGAQFQRQNVALPDVGSGDPTSDEDGGGRFYAGAPSQTFYHFLASLYERKDLLTTNPQGRRLFLVFGRRGVGKGHFFAALSGEARLQEFRDAIGDTKQEWPAAFFNTGLSHEFSSVFDLFVEFLLRTAEALTPGRSVITDLAEKVRKPRIGRVERMKLVLVGLADKAAIKALDGRRIIVAISGMSTLFNPDGQPKNPQIRRLFNAMLCNEGRKAPVDILLLSGERWLPAAFRPGERKPDQEALREFDIARVGSMRLTGLRRSKLPRSSEMELERALRAVNLATKEEEKKPEASQAFAHYLYSARASIVLAAFFPSVALVVALRALDQAGHPSVNFRNVCPEVMLPRTENKLRMVARRLLTLAEPSQYGDWADEAKEAFPWLLLYAAKTSNMKKVWLDEIAALKAPDNQNQKLLFDQIKAEAATVLGGTAEQRKALFERIDGDLKRLFEACGRSRFAFTVLMATAHQCLVPVAEKAVRDARGVAKAISECADFLNNMVLNVEGFAYEQRITFVIETAMRRQKERDARLDEILPLGDGGGIKIKPGPGLVRLENALLWQIAVIGQPVNIHVLTRAPLVVAASRALYGESGFDAKQAKGIIQQVVDLLVRRCLVFEVWARQPPRPGRPEELSYAVHRLVQRNVFRHMHAPAVEYAETNQFTLTLFVTQSHAVPRLTQQAHADLRLSVATMIGYPELPGDQDAIASWYGADPPSTRLKAQLLRAALGMVRSVYSLSTLAKLKPAQAVRQSASSDPAPYHPGLIEEHRLLISWMLRQAVELDKENRNPNADDTAILRPYYAEEIVWLYNECAVLSHMQGRLPNAIALFERADTAAHTIEPFADGALRIQININRALTNIERGRLEFAEKALREIRAIPDEDPVVELIAAGLLGVVHHLRGRYRLAEQDYAHALGITPASASDEGTLPAKPNEGLIARDRSRAASIFARHYSDLLRVQRNFKPSADMIAQSITLAIEGGHEDVHHLAQLSKTRLIIAREPSSDFGSMHRDLDVIEDYAMVMGMARMQCEVDLTRTQLYQRGGDLKAAAHTASRGLTIATSNGLRLRKTSFLLRLATIAHAQGRIHECRPLLEEAFEIARDTEHHMARAEGQKLWAQIATASTPG